MKCWYHLCRKDLTGLQKKFCSIKHKNRYYVRLNRRKIKQKAIDYKGGKCSLCGYNKCNRALEFHHKDSSTKEYGIGDSGITRSWKRVKEELEKCILVCSNCHCEIHSGLAQLVEQVAVNNKV